MTLIIALLIAPFAMLTLCFAIEVLAGLKPLPRPRPAGTGSVRAAIVVPAHDEAAIVGPTLDRLSRQLPEGVGILLVADNCSDSTAAIGRKLGVEVIERFDPAHRGKGFALDFARDHLRASPPEVVLIVDADCSIDRNSIVELVQTCEALGRPSQATNLQKPALDASPAVQMSTFAFFIKNVIRQRGLQRLAGRANLLGTGMAFPWSILDGAELATDHITEDMKLGQQLAAAGYAPVAVEQAMVWSNAESRENTLSQRRRWEGGFLQNLLQTGPRTFLRSVIRADARGTWGAIHLLIPPLALLGLLLIVVFVLAIGITIIAGALWWPVLSLAGSAIFALVAVALAWVAGGRRFITLSGLFRIPLYVAWKIPMYLGFVRGGAPAEWRRTERG